MIAATAPHLSPPVVLAADPTPVRTVAAGADLNGAWSNLMGLLPAGMTTVLAVAGVALIIWVLLRWWWKSRHGGQGGLRGAPVMGIIIGLVLAAPAVLVPIILALLSALLTMISNIITGLTNMFG